MKAFGNRIIVKPDAISDKVGSLFAPIDAVKKNMKYRYGEVIDIGDSGEFEVAKGDRILYLKATEQELDEFSVVPCSAILFVYERN